MKFFILVFAFSVPFWLAGAAAGRGLPLPVGLPISALALVCPLSAALILAYRENKRDGIKGLFAGILDFRRIRPASWYAPILLMMPLVFLGTYGILRFAGRALSEPRVSLIWAPALVVLFFIEAIFEEAGWMGFAYPRLRKRWSALSAGVIIGLAWGVWHIIPNVQQGHTATWILWKCLEAVGLRVLIVWAYSNSGKTVLSAALIHVMYNVSWSVFPVYGSQFDPAVGGPLIAVAAGIVTWLWGPATLARLRFTQLIRRRI